MTQSVEEHQSRTETVGTWTIRIKSYKLGNGYICTVDNVDSGAVVARATGATREEAETKAVDQAKIAMGGS